MKLFSCILLLFLLVPLSVLSETRALLTACHDFLSQPPLGNAVSGNLQLLATALLSSDIPIGNVYIEDGTIDSPDALRAAMHYAFNGSTDDDTLIFYLCTHGFPYGLNSGPSLLLSDGIHETILTPEALFDLLLSYSGNKIVILDACYSGAFIDAANKLFPAWPSSLSILTSAQATESAWYYDHEGMENGALSYFAGALCRGMGLYGQPLANADGDEFLTLLEMEQYLRQNVASSTCRLRSLSAHDVYLPISNGLLSLPANSFSSSSCLLTYDRPTFRFSFTLENDTLLQYRLTKYINGKWAWDNSTILNDMGDNILTPPGKKNRTLRVELSDAGTSYLLFQLFAFQNDEPILCAERLLALQEMNTVSQFDFEVPDRIQIGSEIPIKLSTEIPIRYTITVFDLNGHEIRHLLSGTVSRPSFNNTEYIFWDGLDEDGRPCPCGIYEINISVQFGDAKTSQSGYISIEP